MNTIINTRTSQKGRRVSVGGGGGLDYDVGMKVSEGGCKRVIFGRQSGQEKVPPRRPRSRPGQAPVSRARILLCITPMRPATSCATASG